MLIAAERKRRWKHEAEKRVEYRSLTDLVVTPVENELRDEPVVGGVDVDLEDAHDRLDTIKELMDEMEDTIDETYTLVRTERWAGMRN